MDLMGKVAVVSGSTSGIGLGIAHHLASKGSSLVITGLATAELVESLLTEFRSKYNGRYEFIEGDLRYEQSTVTLCKKILETFPEGVDIIVNNAGIQYVCEVEDYPVEKWNEMIAISLTSSFLLIKYLIPAMKSKGWGRIINIASQMSFVSSVGRVPYSTVKSGLIGMTKGVALEAAQHGVTCNAICPGFADAPIGYKLIQDYAAEKNLSYEEAKDEFSKKNPTQKMITIDQISEMVLYLCSPGASNVTGSSLLMDGGYTAR